jgi:predicted RNase H-like HicB family nuclease
MFYVKALYEPDTEKGGFVVYFPDFPWGVTQG